MSRLLEVPYLVDTSFEERIVNVLNGISVDNSLDSFETSPFN
jgi:hypothetical protein